VTSVKAIDSHQLTEWMCHQCVIWRDYGVALLLPGCGPSAGSSMTPVRRWITHPGLALAATLLAGVFELLALARSRSAARLRALR
jgi:hypothetical protein